MAKLCLFQCCPKAMSQIFGAAAAGSGFSSEIGGDTHSEQVA
eukprot:CAMPEP_0197494090 /NCGR_PEP_ID=MMETSP1311-20131121/26998_1 /TAXON_ID=464262 /ORGANISM="Genus nov. species nov., Strain RCC856" /LENGTH=41 /DNA_ID= /DNA_START= /DNA_END= /DNA_ORIENTATION=